MITASHPRRAFAALGVAALLALTACGGGDDEDASDTTTTEASTTEAETTTTAEETTTTGDDKPDDTTDDGTDTTTTEAAGDLQPYSFSDDFSTDTGWLIGCNEGSGCALVRDGRLAEALDAGQREIDQHSDFQGQILTNVSISTKILDFGDGNPEAGAVCHYDPDEGSYYDFTIRADGTGSVYKFTGEGGGEPLADRFEVPLFTEGNEYITATCTIEPDGSVRLTMEANFSEVVDVTDSTDPLLPGQIGLVTYGDLEVDSSVSFDDLDVEGQLYVE